MRVFMTGYDCIGYANLTTDNDNDISAAFGPILHTVVARATNARM